MSKSTRLVAGLVLSAVCAVLVFVVSDQLLVVVTGNIHGPALLIAGGLGIVAMILSNVIWQRWLDGRSARHLERKPLL